jgi:hypothetical protein
MNCHPSLRRYVVCLCMTWFCGAGDLLFALEYEKQILSAGCFSTTYG